MIMSLNQKVLCSPYKGDRKPQAQVRNGLATVKQRTAIVALKVLADARINDQLTIKKGSLVHLHENLLATRQSVTTALESEVIGEPFVAVDFGDILFVSQE